MLPTFIIPGAGKSGTTALWRYVSEHPEVCMARQKEPAYFTRVVGRSDGAGDMAPWTSGNYHKGLEWYESLYQLCGDAKARGEASTVYMLTEDTPGLIHAVIPEIKLIFILRDPVKRLLSQYWQERKVGTKLPDFGDMFRERPPRFRWYLHVSSYHIHLSRFLDVFSRDQIRLSLYEDLLHTPQQLIQGVYRAIGVSPGYVPPGLGARWNVSRLPRVVWLARILHSVTVREWALRLSPSSGLWIRAIGRALVGLNSIPWAYPPMPPELRRQLVEELTPTIEFVERYLDRPIPAWREA
jgi:hypothetical protein